MERRVRIYREWQGDYGDIIVQLNVEDTAFGVADYVVQELGVETIELKWGQGAKCIGGEIKIRDLDRAIELQKRGYIITPNPGESDVCDSFRTGGIKEFERHSRLGFIDEEQFLHHGRAAAQAPGSQTGHPEDRRLRVSGAGPRHQVVVEGACGSGHHRWVRRRHGHEPLADDGRVGGTHLLSAVDGIRVRQTLGHAGRVDARSGHGRRLLDRGPYLQGAGHGCALLQGCVHGPCTR